MFDEEDEEPPSDEDLADEAPRCTDSANVDAIVREHGKGYRFVVDWESWIAWDGKRWNRVGARGRVMNAALLTARLEHYRTRERLDALEEEFRKGLIAGQKDEDLEARVKNERRLLKWHEQSQNVARIDAATKLLETRLVVSVRDLDRNPWLLNVANGTLDLRSAELRPHSQQDLITQVCDVDWDDEAACPTWDAFVRGSMGGDLALSMYLQRLIGYSITALTTEHLLVFFWGDGNNGKSTFVQVLRTILGEYACAAPRELLFEDKNGQRHPADMARLYGKRMAICAEVGEHVTLDEAKVKDLTGGDAISVRRMREDFWDLEPTHTLFVAGNHKPIVRGNDGGIWRRIRLVPWTVIVAAADIDTGLPAKLRAEASGILRWAVHGCLEWQANGMATPAVVTEATQTYRAESDALGEFLDSHLVFETEGRVSCQTLRETYEAWCVEAGHKPYGPKKVGQRLKEKHCSKVTVKEHGKAMAGWRGVRLKDSLELALESRLVSGEKAS